MEICLLLCSGEDVEYSFSKYKNLGFVKSQVTFWNVMRRLPPLRISLGFSLLKCLISANAAACLLPLISHYSSPCICVQWCDAGPFLELKDMLLLLFLAKYSRLGKLT